MVTVSSRGKCKNIELTPSNGEPDRCLISVELDRGISPTHDLYMIRLSVPVEFANLFETGLAITVTIDQNGS